MSDLPATPTSTATTSAVPRPVWHWAVWAVAAVVAVALTMRYDAPLEALYDRYTDNVPFLKPLAHILTQAISILPLALAALLLKLFDRRLKWRFYYEFAVVMLTQMVASSVLKQFVGRPRPSACHEIPTIFHGPNLTDFNSSFPSGHATATFALAVLMGCYYPRWRVLFYVLAAIIPFCRVQVDRHFISDIVAGAFLGWAVANWTLQYLRRRQAQREAAAAVTATSDM